MWTFTSQIDHVPLPPHLEVAHQEGLRILAHLLKEVLTAPPAEVETVSEEKAVALLEINVARKAAGVTNEQTVMEAQRRKRRRPIKLDQSAAQHPSAHQDQQTGKRSGMGRNIKNDLQTDPTSQAHAQKTA